MSTQGQQLPQDSKQSMQITHPSSISLYLFQLHVPLAHRRNSELHRRSKRRLCWYTLFSWDYRHPKRMRTTATLPFELVSANCAQTTNHPSKSVSPITYSTSGRNAGHSERRSDAAMADSIAPATHRWLPRHSRQMRCSEQRCTCAAFHSFAAILRVAGISIPAQLNHVAHPTKSLTCHARQPGDKSAQKFRGHVMSTIRASTVSLSHSLPRHWLSH